MTTSTARTRPSSSSRINRVDLHDIGVVATPRIGDTIRLDARPKFVLASRLMQGDDFCDDGYPGSDFRVYNQNSQTSSAINVVVTGRTAQLWAGAFWVRINVEFVGDCEPSTFTGGWLRLEMYGQTGLPAHPRIGE